MFPCPRGEEWFRAGLSSYLSSSYLHHTTITIYQSLTSGTFNSSPQWLSLFHGHICNPQSPSNCHPEDVTLQFFLHPVPLLPRTRLVPLDHFCTLLLHVQYISVASETLVAYSSCCFSYPSPVFHQNFLACDITLVPKDDLPKSCYSFQTSFYSRHGYLANMFDGVNSQFTHCA